MIRAVLFDLDETLLTRATAIRTFIADQYDRHRDSLAAVGRDAFVARFLALEDGGHTAKAKVYLALLAEFGVTTLSPEALLADYQAIYPRFATLADGALVALANLRASGLKLGIITNGNATLQNGKIDATGLKPLLDCVLVSEAEGVSKPDPAIFARALELLNVTADEAVFVGDNPAIDINGARMAGLEAVWFHSSTEWPDNLTPPVHTITRMAILLSCWREIFTSVQPRKPLISVVFRSERARFGLPCLRRVDIDASAYGAAG